MEVLARGQERARPVPQLQSSEEQQLGIRRRARTCQTALGARHGNAIEDAQTRQSVEGREAIMDAPMLADGIESKIQLYEPPVCHKLRYFLVSRDEAMD
jgi:hypothetical protein